MMDTYDVQICDHCGCEFSHTYFSGGTRTCTTCEITHNTAPEPQDNLVDEFVEDEWFTEERYAISDVSLLQAGF